MAEEKDIQKSEAAKREEDVLAFWEKYDVFNKTLQKEAPNGDFIFYDGPPFATGLPHHGSLLSSIIKDVVPRYKTMRGFHVRRRWGWDTHGLPIENLVEKELGLKTKKDILEIGIAKFNETARSMVLKYVDDWKRYVDRVGRWVDYDNSYKTMDNTYIESVWWALKKLWDDKKLYEGRKVLMYCPHCETPLAKAEIAADNTYKDVTETAVTVKFVMKDAEKHGYPEGTAFLAWTTTPWTLPGNVALAVGSLIKYVLVRQNENYYILARDLVQEGMTVEREVSGQALKGIQYESLFEVPEIANSDKAHRVYAADFVTTNEGTGIVHTAVMYGEDDFELGKREGLPVVQLLNSNATYNDASPKLVRGQHIKKAGPLIIEDLEKRGLLFEASQHTHSYPHCWRCGTALIYNAVSSWFIDIQSVKVRMLEENKKVDWVPMHLRDGRFGNIVESAPDWTISRNRFWASPLPIWKERDGDGLLVIGSLKELREHVQCSGNTYFTMRHGESEKNVSRIVTNDPDAPYPLTEKGREEVKVALDECDKQEFDLIITSPVLRARETALVAAEHLGIHANKVVIDDRIRESEHGEWEGQPLEDFEQEFKTDISRFERSPKGGENWIDIRRRVGDFLYELEAEHQNKRILIVSHGDPLALLHSAAKGLSRQETITYWDEEYPQKGSLRQLDFTPLPHDAHYELDFHRPYIDDIVLMKDGKEYERIPEVVDCWVESGAMPFAEYHYPFENKEEFEKRAPGDFIAEYIGQTRTWFYYMHAMGVLLFDRLAFRSVVSTGNLLAADGAKISKSKGNYTDPLALINQYGSDAYRLYLMGSSVMQSEDLCFRDEDVRELHNRFIGILWNSYQFFALYQGRYDGVTRTSDSRHVLDRWLHARLAQVVRDVTTSMDAYELPRVVKALRAFLDDYSTWYVRRSRDRVKGEGEDAQYALATQREALLTISRLVAPIAPFIAEDIWRGVGGDTESVHLAPWPEASTEPDEALLEAMVAARTAVSQILELRSGADIKVRQPLARATLRSAPQVSADEILAVVADEVNVKEVVHNPVLEEEVSLDTTLTPDLAAEGEVRELIRAIQDLRKEKKLTPDEKVTLTVSTDDYGRELIEHFKDEITKTTCLSEISFAKREGKNVVLGEHTFTVSL